MNSRLNTRQWGKAQRRKIEQFEMEKQAASTTPLLWERDAALKEARDTIQFLREQNARLATRNRELILLASPATYQQLLTGIEALPETTAKMELLRIMIGKPPVETKKGQD